MLSACLSLRFVFTSPVLQYAVFADLASCGATQVARTVCRALRVPLQVQGQDLLIQKWCDVFA